MDKHQIEIDLTVLKQIVAEYWQNPEKKEKYFRSYQDSNGTTHNIITADLCLMTPKYAEKGDGSKIESETAILHNTGFAQFSEKQGEEWVNKNFARVKKWIDKVDTTPPQPVETQEINPDDIPF